MSPQSEGSEPLLSRRDAAKLFAATAAGLALGSASASRAAVPVPATPGLDVAPLRGRIAGTIITRGEPTYEAVRQSMIWNGQKATRQPAAIVRAASTQDVQEVVRFARQTGTKVAIRGGGHSWCAASMRDGGILLDLGALRQVTVDEKTKRVSAQPALPNEELVRHLEPHGLAFPVGHCPGVPLSGYLLAGGIGWNSGTWGPACHSVRAMEIVTADGELVRASEEENPDLFWAARGGGAGFFGVITRYELQAYDLPKAIRTVTLFIPTPDPQRDAGTVGRWLSAMLPTLPHAVELNCMLSAAPPGLPPGAPQAGERVVMVLAAAFADTDDEARQMLAPLLSPPTEVQALQPFTTPIEEAGFEQLLAGLGTMLPKGLRYDVDVFWCQTSAEDAMGRLAPAAAGAPSPRSGVLVGLMPPPQTDAPPPPDVALSMFAPVFVAVYGISEQEGEVPANRSWVRTTAAAVREVTVGHYIGEVDLSAGADRARKSYAPAAWDRLRALKAKYDPTGVFHDYLGQTV